LPPYSVSFWAMICETSMRYSSFALSEGARNLHRLQLSAQRERQRRDNNRRCGHNSEPSIQPSGENQCPSSLCTWEGDGVTNFTSELEDSRGLEQSWSAELDFKVKFASASSFCTEIMEEPHVGQDPRSPPETGLGSGGTPVEPQYWYGCYGPLTATPVYDPSI